MAYNNYSLLKTLILEEILGDRNSKALSLELGFKFDKYKRWMKNLKILRWSEFEFLCAGLNLDLEDALKVIQPFLKKVSADENLFHQLRRINHFETNKELADYLSCHISVIKRYLANTTTPDVEVVFNLMNQNPNLLADFLFRLFKNKILNKDLLEWIENHSKSSQSETTHYQNNKKMTEIIEQLEDKMLSSADINYDQLVKIKSLLSESFKLTSNFKF